MRATISRLALKRFPPITVSKAPAHIAPILAARALCHERECWNNVVASTIPSDKPAPITAPSSAPVIPFGLWPNKARTVSTPSSLVLPPTTAPPAAPPTTDHHLL